MIRDFLVLGSTDQGATARLFHKQDELTLKTAVDELKISEVTKRQMLEMTIDNEESQPIHYTKHASEPDHKHEKQQFSHRDKDCIYCGKPHKPSKTACLAYGQTPGGSLST